MDGWKRSSDAYLFNRADFPNACEVLIAEIAPVRRALSHGVFNNDQETGLPARDRVVRILKGFRDRDKLPPVVVQKVSDDAAQRYRLTQGAHRFYLSIAAGFTHIPAVIF